MKHFFITGIGTDVGKTHITAALLHKMHAQGIHATSFKLVQTGIEEGSIAPDILAHRHGSGQAISALDQAGLSCGAHFAYPASPHLAAALAGQQIDGAVLWQRYSAFCQQSNADIVLCEGAGGIFVPLSESELTVDWLAARRATFTLVLVSHAQLGSIHDTIATLEALAARAMLPQWLIYNPYPSEPAVIVRDSARFLQQYIARHFPNTAFWQYAQDAALPAAFCYNSALPKQSD